MCCSKSACPDEVKSSHLAIKAARRVRQKENEDEALWVPVDRLTHLVSLKHGHWTWDNGQWTGKTLDNLDPSDLHPGASSVIKAPGARTASPAPTAKTRIGIEGGRKILEASKHFQLAAGGFVEEEISQEEAG